MSPVATVGVVFVAALACALAATPAARGLARAIGFFDRPGAGKTHQAPVPLLGGVAIYAAVVLSIVVFGRHFLRELAGILSGASLMALAGLVDDRVRLSTPRKGLVQLGVVTGVILAGVRVQLGWLPPSVDLLVSLLWVLGITNAMNLLDNMDGLCGGVSAIAAAGIALLALLNGQYMVASLAGAVAGACVGFLVFNTRPASVFMGDAGSLFLGFLLAVLGVKLRFPGRPDTVTWLVPVLVMAVPIFDTTLVTVSRLRRGVNPFTSGGHDHLSHRLVARGLAPALAVAVLHLVAAAAGLVAVAVSGLAAVPAYALAALVALAAAVALHRLELTDGR